MQYLWWFVLGPPMVALVKMAGIVGGLDGPC